MGSWKKMPPKTPAPVGLLGVYKEFFFLLSVRIIYFYFLMQYVHILSIFFFFNKCAKYLVDKTTYLLFVVHVVHAMDMLMFDIHRFFLLCPTIIALTYFD